MVSQATTPYAADANPRESVELRTIAFFY